MRFNLIAGALTFQIKNIFERVMFHESEMYVGIPIWRMTLLVISRNSVVMACELKMTGRDDGKYGDFGVFMEVRGKLGPSL